MVLPCLSTQPVSGGLELRYYYLVYPPSLYQVVWSCDIITLFIHPACVRWFGAVIVLPYLSTQPVSGGLEL